MRAGPALPAGPVVALVALVALVACSFGPGSAASSSDAVGSAEGAELTIFAAASLTTALDQATAAYEEAHPGTALSLSTDSSAALATQIEQGAPADVFLSADTTNARKLVDAGLADGDAIPFAGNELTIITPADNRAGLTGPFDLGTPGVRVVAAGDQVPITKYATQVIDNLAAEAGAPAGFAAAYAANVVSKEDNVAAVQAKIALGEGDAAIVYVTDAATADAVATIEIPASANVAATYAGVVVKASSDREAAHAFLDWLVARDGQTILAEYGFLPPSP